MKPSARYCPSHRRCRLWRETLLVYVGAVAPIAILHPFRQLPFVHEYLWTAALVLQVYLPAWMLLREGRPIATAGLHLHNWPEGIRWWLGMSLLFLPPTIVGHHIWQKWNGFHFESRLAPYRQFPYSLRGTPPPPRSPEIVQIFADANRPEITIRWWEPLSGKLRSDGHLRVLSGAKWVLGKSEGRYLYISGGGGNPCEIRLRVEALHLRFFFRRKGKDLPLEFIRVGPQQAPISRPEVARTWWWLLYLLLAQLLMVALPEEFLYRGFLLPRLDSLYPPRYFKGIPLSWGNVLTSALFALTHFVIGWNLYRLSVFFPSLLFGILKQRTRSLLAPILFHASANIFIKLLEVWYF